MSSRPLGAAAASEPTMAPARPDASERERNLTQCVEAGEAVLMLFRQSLRREILVVEDDINILQTTAAMLSREGYSVSVARDGFEALSTLRKKVPTLLVSDLDMPKMSGFELLWVVRNRFPSVCSIAMSGSAEAVSRRVVADRWAPKGGSPTQLLQVVRELMSAWPLRSPLATGRRTPAWVPRTRKGYALLSCPECLRAFFVATAQPDTMHETPLKTECPHCGVEVQYYLDPNFWGDRAEAKPAPVLFSPPTAMASTRSYERANYRTQNKRTA